MLDAIVRPRIDPTLDKVGRVLARWGFRPNSVTLIGFAVGMACIPLNALGWLGPSALCLFFNRLADGLDGAVARARGGSDGGGYLDIVCDFLFYSGFVFGFAIASKDFTLPAAFLLFSFMGTCASFLAFAIFAQKHGLSTELRGPKAFYYLGGLTEGSETILLFVLMLLFPAVFPWLAWGFGAACWLTVVYRVVYGFRVLKGL